MKNTPIVSVCMITYGHEKFIEQAINGVLMQETDFDFELIIANDSSPDSTDDIIKKIITNHPKSHMIKYICHNKNIGMMPNFVDALKQCKGKYIALCEGDDYWIDSQKLKKQISFLEQNQEYNFSMGKVYKYYEDTKKTVFSDSVNPTKKETYFLKDYVKEMFSQTSSFVFRNNFELPSWYSKVHAGDQSLVIIATGNKKIKYHNDFFSVYRINSQSVSFNTNHRIAFEKSLFFFKCINQHTNNQYANIVLIRKLNNYLFYKMKQLNNPIFDFLFKVVMKFNNYFIRLFL